MQEKNFEKLNNIIKKFFKPFQSLNFKKKMRTLHLGNILNEKKDIITISD